MKLLEHKNLLIERTPNHKVGVCVPWYEEPVLCALHNKSDNEEGEGVFVTESSPPVMLAVDWDPNDAWLKLVGKYSNDGQIKDGHHALYSVYKGPKDFARQVGELEDAPEAKASVVTRKPRQKKAQPAQAAA